VKNEVDRRVRILSKSFCDQCIHSILRFPGGTIKFTWQYDYVFFVTEFKNSKLHHQVKNEVDWMIKVKTRELLLSQPNSTSTWVGASLDNGYEPTTYTNRELLGNLGSWFSVCNLILTQLERQAPPKNQKDFKKMKNGRRPQKKKWTTTLILRQSYWDYLTTTKT
jgi:hypothetical protein